MNVEPVVSIVVLTYNSQNTIEKTLNSIYKQSYKTIEVIVQDDCSKDATIQIAKDWGIINNAEQHLLRYVVRSNSENKGTSFNVNEGCSVALGKWIKIIAGDDILLEDCIEQNIEFSNNQDENILIVSDVIDFYEKEDKFVVNPNVQNFNQKRMRMFNVSTAKKQYKMVLKSYNLNAPTFFFSKKTLVEIGGFDTRYGLMEDWPFVIRWTKYGNCIRYLERPTVYYRTGDPGTTKSENFFSVEHLNRIYQLKKDEIYPNISKWNMMYWINEKMTQFNQYIMIHLFHNKMTPKSTVINYLMTWLIPYNWGMKVRILKTSKLSGLLKRQKWNLRE